MQYPKMNRLIFFMLVLVATLFGQENYMLAKNLEVLECEQKLFVDDGDGMMMGYADANLVMTNKYFGLKERLNSKRWQGYYGLKRISESRFFETAGFVLEANNAIRYQSIRQGVFWTGTGLAILGVLIGSIQFIKNEHQWQWGSQAFGIGLFTAGLAVDAIWFFSPPNRFSLGTALNAANKYNKRE
jgi:hypothetical protein